MGLVGLGVGLMAASQYAEGRAAQTDAQNQAAIAEYNAQVKEQEARQTEARSRFESIRQAEAAARGMGEMEAGMGASGVIPTTGTPLLVQARQASEYELENLMIGYEGQIGASRARSEAAGYQMSAQAYRSQASNAMRSAWLNVGTTLLTGFAEPISNWGMRQGAMRRGLSAGSARTITGRSRLGGYTFGPYEG